MSDVTQILREIRDGKQESAEQLLSLVYTELKRIAAQKMAGEAPGNTLQPTALVHEAWLRLVGEGDQWNGRNHFFMAAAEAMRRILIEHARQKRRQKRWGNQQRVPLEEVDLAVNTHPETLLLVNEALERLKAEDARAAQVAELRFYIGLTVEETAKVLGVSIPTANRDWTYARARLFREIKPLL